ncbi:MAG: Rpn family recombination-promoting nuclease/putative transposase, partial [Bacteroides sp.]|nr:Rpn family recombination-promoting nuclease/putative transposase [Bacteroides sp.]
MSKHRYQLLETKTLKRMTDKLEFVFVEVAKFNKSEDELETDLDKWLYLLKNMSTLLERPAALRDRVFGRLFDVAEYARLDDEER